MTSDEAIVRTEKLSRTYQQGTVEVHALRAVDFACRRGEFVALAGPSGSTGTSGSRYDALRNRS